MFPDHFRKTLNKILHRTDSFSSFAKTVIRAAVRPGTILHKDRKRDLRKNVADPSRKAGKEIRTLNLLITDQLRYRCAIPADDPRNFRSTVKSENSEASL